MQGEDVAARGRVLLFNVDRTNDNSRTPVSCLSFVFFKKNYVFIYLPKTNYLYSCVCSQVLEVFSKEFKGAISALASLQGHLLIASGPKIILHKWTGSELIVIAFYDVPPLHVVSLNIVSTLL